MIDYILLALLFVGLGLTHSYCVHVSYKHGKNVGKEEERENLWEYLTPADRVHAHKLLNLLSEMEIEENSTLEDIQEWAHDISIRVTERTHRKNENKTNGVYDI